MVGNAKLRHYVAEDSVPNTTERSFNAEGFPVEVDRPFVIGLVAKDFKENDTGLENTGMRRKQMGDGGVTLQIKDTAAKPVVVSNFGWQCLVVHSAPLDDSCADKAVPVAGEGACTFEATEETDGGISWILTHQIGPWPASIPKAKSVPKTVLTGLS